MDSEADQQLHIFFFPFVAYGHMIPTIDIAKLFAARGVKTTIILTPLNASVLSNSIDRERSLGLDIHIQVIKFPGVEAGLPEGVESCDDMTSPEMVPKLFQAVKMLQEPLEQLIEEYRPDSIVADMFLPFATEAASKYGIPRFVFHGTSFNSQCVEESLICHRPYVGIASDREPFLVPGLPDKIEMTRLQLNEHFKVENGFHTEVRNLFRDAEQKNYGILVNSFNELEPAYAMHYNKVLGKRAWAIGPVSLRNRDSIDKVQRGKKTAINEHVVLKWLDSKKPNSVLYICFGSMARFSKAQLLEIAVGLEDSRVSFIWVVRTIRKEEEESFLPEGFEDRMEGKGLIIREWAPQVLILDHPAVGGFMTHCGWNSILEGLSAGVPMITWPMFAEQFHNENFITQVLKMGIPVGVEKWNDWIDAEDVQVKKEKIANVVSRLMGDGEEGKNMRMRAKELGEKAKVAVEEGGSSNENLTALIQELQMVKKASTTRHRVPSSQVF
ncbi:hypothetical protein MKW98_015250 [Papaver atlanticum]|uniref:Glycosyltransferase n=1 Tax=Papaver atlanticum TaxID=357466 RepID=A0AAD4XNU3_9MAGN|nr:hypothetical protein MKW98_015250 [Papaver atlanticum]